MSADTVVQDIISGSENNIQSGGETGTDPQEENKFQQAISAWRNLNLTHLVSQLDVSASQLVEHQKESVIQRKEVAQKTKDFRKLDDAAKLVEVKTLLKLYQNFIDLLTNQSKSVSTAFLSTYTPLSEVPDPYPLLEASIESLVASEELVPRLESENKHLQQTVAKLTNQLDEAESRLSQERSARQSIENNQDKKIEEIEQKWTAVLSEKEENWTAKEQTLEEKVSSQDRLLKEVKANYEVSQRLEQAHGDGMEAANRKANQVEMDMLSAELERTTLRLSQVESRNEQLRLELAQTSVKTGTSHRVSVEDDPVFLRLRTENTSLLRKLDSIKYDKSSEQGQFEGRIKTLEREINTLTGDRDVLRTRLEKFGDYDEMKQELEMIRAIEFGTGEENDTTENNDGQTKSESLEQLLLARNKKLNNELAEFRISKRDLQAELEDLKENLSVINLDLEKSRTLNAQLENEVLEAQQNISNLDAMSVAGTYTSRYPKSSYAASRRGGTSPTSSIISGFDGGRSPQTTSGSIVSGGAGILPMVTAQRDRFKKKLSDLETELQKSYATITSLRSEIASLQKDNLNLYERTRYVNTYNSNAQTNNTSSSSKPSSGPQSFLPSTRSDIIDDKSAATLASTEQRYKSAYESNLSPFAAFRGRESARMFKDMTLPERFVFALTKTVLQTRFKRNMFALYCFLLHAVVVYFMLLDGVRGHNRGTSSIGKSKVVVGIGDQSGGGLGGKS